MINQLLANGVPVQLVKQGTFRYVEQVCQEGIGVRYGNAISSYVEAECYYKVDGTAEVNEGDSILYMQVYDVDDEFEPIGTSGLQQIGVFTVKKCVKGKHSYTFIAYDNLEKLNASYSDILAADKASFPMSIQAFLNQLASSALSNFNVGILVSELNIYNLSDPTNQMIDYFYADGLSYKDILMYFAELSSQYITCEDGNNVHFKRFSTTPNRSTPYWKNSDRYIIAPTDQVTYTGTADIGGTPTTVNLIPVFYKQDGLEHENFSFVGLDRFTIKDPYGAEWWYAQTRVYPPLNNNYVIQKNALVNKLIVDDTVKDSFVLGGMSAIHTLLTDNAIYPFEAHLFPFRNPFNAGQILPHIEDEKGNRFSSVIMKMEQTDSEVILTCSGAERYYTSASDNYDAEENAQMLNIVINDLNDDVNDLESNKADTDGGNINATGFREALGLGATATTTTISNIATAASNSTIVSASYAEWGKLASVELEITRSINTGTTADVTVATLVSGKRPAVNSPAVLRYLGNIYYAYVQTNGQIRFRTPNSIPSGTSLIFNAVYLLA